VNYCEIGGEEDEPESSEEEHDAEGGVQHCSSKYRGVNWCAATSKWRASICHNGKQVYVSTLFEDEEEAARGYDRAAKVHHGSKAVLNFPAGGEGKGGEEEQEQEQEDKGRVVYDPMTAKGRLFKKYKGQKGCSKEGQKGRREEKQLVKQEGQEQRAAIISQDESIQEQDQFEAFSQSQENRFVKGELVRAQWGSGKRWYDAVVLDAWMDGSYWLHYKVDDEQYRHVPASKVKAAPSKAASAARGYKRDYKRDDWRSWNSSIVTLPGQPVPKRVLAGRRVEVWWEDDRYSTAYSIQHTPCTMHHAPYIHAPYTHTPIHHTCILCTPYSVWFDGVVSRVHHQDGACDVHYDDGDAEHTVSADLIRWPMSHQHTQQYALDDGDGDGNGGGDTEQEEGEQEEGEQEEQGGGEVQVVKKRSHHFPSKGSKRPASKHPSKYRGVTWEATKKTWRVRITYGRKQHNIGYFKEEEAAARAYDQEATKGHGKNAILNFPGEQSAVGESAVDGTQPCRREHAVVEEHDEEEHAEEEKEEEEGAAERVEETNEEDFLLLLQEQEQQQQEEEKEKEKGKEQQQEQEQEQEQEPQEALPLLSLTSQDDEHMLEGGGAQKQEDAQDKQSLQEDQDKQSLTILTQKALEDFYSIHSPTTVDRAAWILEQAKGQERELVATLRGLYGAVPELTVVREESARESTSRQARETRARESDEQQGDEQQGGEQQGDEKAEEKAEEKTEAISAVKSISKGGEEDDRERPACCIEPGREKLLAKSAKRDRPSSGFYGVCAKGKRWKAQIYYRSTQQNLGIFDTKQEAALAYDRGARQCGGDKPLNFESIHTEEVPQQMAEEVGQQMQPVQLHPKGSTVQAQWLVGKHWYDAVVIEAWLETVVGPNSDAPEDDVGKRSDGTGGGGGGSSTRCKVHYWLYYKLDDDQWQTAPAAKVRKGVHRAKNAEWGAVEEGPELCEEAGTSCGKELRRNYECNSCGQGFETGKALGGHRRWCKSERGGAPHALKRKAEDEDEDEDEDENEEEGEGETEQQEEQQEEDGGRRFIERGVRRNQLQLEDATDPGADPAVGAEVVLLETHEKGTVVGASKKGWFRIRLEGDYGKVKYENCSKLTRVKKATKAKKAKEGGAKGGKAKGRKAKAPKRAKKAASVDGGGSVDEKGEENGGEDNEKGGEDNEKSGEENESLVFSIDETIETEEDFGCAIWESAGPMASSEH
jgi:hypothetical protein